MLSGRNDGSKCTADSGPSTSRAIISWELEHLTGAARKQEGLLAAISVVGFNGPLIEIERAASSAEELLSQAAVWLSGGAGRSGGEEPAPPGRKTRLF